MKHERILNHLLQVDQKVMELKTEIDSLQALVVSLIEENVALSMECDHLRAMQEASSNPEHSESYKNNTLERLYDEGFHVCNIHFGTHRQNEACLFCQDFIRVDE